jgi:hypothetical protein
MEKNLYCWTGRAAFLLVLLGMYACSKEEPLPFRIDSFSPGQGIEGTAVTIMGEGFSPEIAKNVVKFGGIVATVSAASATQLTANVPAGASTGKITVETEGRTAASTTDFTVIKEPFITGFAPTQAEEGDEVVVDGSGFQKGPMIVKFNGLAAQTVSVTSNTRLVAVVPDGAVSGKITVEGNGNTSSTTTDFTVLVPVSAKATVTKLAGIPTFPSLGADGLRMVLTNALYITGPGQNTVYRLDLTTLAVSPFLNNILRPISISSDGDQYYVGARSAFYTHRFGNLTNAVYTGSLASGVYSLKFARQATASKYSYLCTSFYNEIYGILNSTAGGNSVSSFTATLINTQLNGIPSNASAMLATNEKSIFVSGNQAIWKLQANNTLALIAGAPGQAGYVDSKGGDARFTDGGYARGNAIAVDENDNVFVADFGCGCIRKVDSQGNVTTVAGKKTATARTGKGNRMRFNFDTWDIALATDGTLYVVATNDVPSQTLRHAVYKVTF